MPDRRSPNTPDGQWPNAVTVKYSRAPGTYNIADTRAQSAMTTSSVSERVGRVNVPSTHYTSFRRWVFPVNHLHWCWQPNKNNQDICANNTKLTQHKKRPYLTAQHTYSKKPRLRDRTDRAWFRCLVQNPARKRRGSILTPDEPERVIKQE